MDKGSNEFSGTANQGNDKLIDRELTYRIIGCAQKVHAVLGPGFPERVYHRALCHELTKAGIAFESEKIADVPYDTIIAGQFRMDILVEERIVVELKAARCFIEDDFAQANSYLNATKLRLALLFNFGRKSLELKRMVR